jgi:hypothetical protein
MSEQVKAPNNVEVDIEHSTFRDKIAEFLEKLDADLENSKKEIEFHKLIISVFKSSEVDHPFLADLQDSINESEKFIKALEDRKIQGRKLQQFLNGEFVLDFDRFAFLMIDVTGRQVVNFVELKNEFLEVSKLWTTKQVN